MNYIPEQFGAVGDGVTDDTAAFRAAFDVISKARGEGVDAVLVLGPRTYRLGITIPLGVPISGDACTHARLEMAILSRGAASPGGKETER